MVSPTSPRLLPCIALSRLLLAQAAIVALTNVPAQDLEQWQQAQRLLVHHDDEGQVRAAEAPPPARAQRRA